MARISKAPAERRLELIETAERLFFRRGFDETTVSDIVGELNVAQGTFYCYFKSKEDVLAAVIHRSIAQGVEKLRTVIAQPAQNTGERLSRLFSGLLSEYSGRSKLALYMQKESNAGIHQKSVIEVVSRVTPLFEEVIRDGNHSGDFSVEHPAEMASLLVGILVHLLHNPGLVDEPPRRERMCATMEQILGASLRAGEKSIQLQW
ncbi:MAG: TetR/AcrR family transcriptional regulator [Chthoniobacteraceae bacterium]